MKVRVSEAVGPVLDWMVAKAEGGTIRTEHGVFLNQGDGYDYFTPSTNWDQSGPIVERECIGFEWMASEWKATQNYAGVPYKDAPSMRPIGQRHLCYGPTPLIAAMRCYVTSKLGEEVEVPDELV
jgi:hypothetical protein